MLNIQTKQMKRLHVLLHQHPKDNTNVSNCSCFLLFLSLLHFHPAPSGPSPAFLGSPLAALHLLILLDLAFWFQVVNLPGAEILGTSWVCNIWWGVNCCGSDVQWPNEVSLPQGLMLCLKERPIPVGSVSGDIGESVHFRSSVQKYFGNVSFHIIWFMTLLFPLCIHSFKWCGYSLEC